MTNQVSPSQGLDLHGIFTAVNQAQALIEFELDGTILHANDNFLNTLGYPRSEHVFVLNQGRELFGIECVK